MPQNDKAPERPQQVTYAAWAVIAGSLVLLISAYQQISTLHTLDTRTMVERLINDAPSSLGITVQGWLSALKVIGMISGASAVAAAILGWQTLQRSRPARTVLLVVAVPLVLTGLATGPFFAIAVAVAVVVLWLPVANAWFDPRPQGRMQAMSEVPPPTGPYGQQPGQPGPAVPPTPPPYSPPYGQGDGQAPQYQPPAAPYGSPYAPPAGYPYGVVPAGPDRRPSAVTAAAVITLSLSGLSGVLGVILAVVGANKAQKMMEELSKRGYDTSSFTTHDLAVGFVVTGSVIAAASVIAIIAAVFVLRRSSAARIVLTVMAGLSIAISLLGITSGASAVTLVGAIVVIVLLYRRASSAWFAGRNGQPRAQLGGPWPGA